MSWYEQIQGDSLSWLMDDHTNSVRVLAMRKILDIPTGDSDFLKAHEEAHNFGAIPEILNTMDEAGYWIKPGAGYQPKYKGTVWSIISLAQLGASIEMDKRIQKACNYLLDHALNENGIFSTSGAPSETIDCLQGNLCAALLDLGVKDERLDKAFNWMARSVTGEGIAPLSDKNAPLRYYAYKCAPNFACGANGKKPCAWGAIKVMLAFSKLPKHQITPIIRQAIQQGLNFLLSVDPAAANYPTSLENKPSPNWWKFGFPVFYITDILQLCEVLANLGCGKDPRLTNALTIIRNKQNDEGRWKMEYPYSDKMWLSYGLKGKPNKWVTLRALQVLKLTF